MSSEPSLVVNRLPGEDLLFDDEAFRYPGLPGVSWESIVGVAKGYEIHPIAIADWDFWAWRATGADSPPKARSSARGKSF